MKITHLSLALIFTASTHSHAQSVYAADWTTLSGVGGAYTVTMSLESGAAVGGISSYTLSIANNNGRDFLNNTGSTITTGPDADIAQETNSFSISGTLFNGVGTLTSSDVINFTNVTGIKGQLLNPTGTAVTSYPISLGENDSTSLQWTSRNFGFDTLRLDPDAGSSQWDEWTAEVKQTWQIVPEPSSALLLGIGGLTLFLRRKR